MLLEYPLETEDWEPPMPADFGYYQRTARRVPPSASWKKAVLPAGASPCASIHRNWQGPAGDVVHSALQPTPTGGGQEPVGG